MTCMGSDDVTKPTSAKRRGAQVAAVLLGAVLSLAYAIDEQSVVFYVLAAGMLGLAVYLLLVSAIAQGTREGRSG